MTGKRRAIGSGLLLIISAAIGGTALGSTVGSAPAQASPSHVAVVIAGDKTVCVPWHSGMTGDELLNSVAQVGYRRSDGLINQIDGRPTGNPPPVSTSAYWSYWHNTGGSWTYSSVGASGYRVPAGSVDGWIFGDGKTAPSGSYGAICAGADAPIPVPTKRPPSSQAIAPPPPRTSNSRPTATAGGGTVPFGSTRTSGPHSPPGQTVSAGSSAPGHPPTASKSTGSVPPAAGTPAAAGTSAAGTVKITAEASQTAGAAAAAAGSGGGRSTAGTITGIAVAVLAVGALGAAAVWQRSRHSG